MKGNVLNPADKKKYQSYVGSFLWLNRGTRPDISHHTWLLATAMSQPTEECLHAARHLARYLSGTRYLKLTYSLNKKSELDLSDYHYDGLYPTGFSDANFGIPKSVTSAFVMYNNAALIWKVKKQDSTSLSTVESELTALSELSCEMEFCKAILSFLNLHFDCSLKTFCDSAGAIQNAKHPIVKQGLKHVSARCFYVREVIDKGIITVHKISGELNPSDIGTKLLGSLKTNIYTGFLMNFTLKD
jgi:hypothetical protein